MTAKATIRELLDNVQVDEVSIRLIQRVEAVLALHVERGGRCAHCDSGSEFIIDWPCQTVRALNGGANDY